MTAACWSGPKKVCQYKYSQEGPCKNHHFRVQKKDLNKIMHCYGSILYTYPLSRLKESSNCVFVERLLSGGACRPIVCFYVNQVQMKFSQPAATVLILRRTHNHRYRGDDLPTFRLMTIDEPSHLKELLVKQNIC